MKTYQIKITGSGTVNQILDSLQYISQTMSALTPEGLLNMGYEDECLMVTIEDSDITATVKEGKQ